MGWKKALRASWKLHPLSGQRRKQRSEQNVPLGIDLQCGGDSFRSFRPFQRPPVREESFSGVYPGVFAQVGGVAFSLGTCE
jgi:hypothetical protein